MTEKDRATARQLAQRHVASGDPLGWFDVLYSTAGDDASNIPWADLVPNPNLTDWLERKGVAGAGRTALKIGCGLGDDAEELSRRGFETTAFDVSPAAIAWCHRRFPDSAVRYVEADLLRPPAEWSAGFDFVLESYTLQVLPPEIRGEAVRRVADLVAPGGTLLVVARGREPGEPEGDMPWPLTRGEMAVFEEAGLTLLDFEDYVDDETPPVRRFRATYRRARPLICRPMAPGEEPEALALVLRVFEECVRSGIEEGDAATFERTARSVIFTPSALHSILVAEDDGRLVGLLATRSDGHISLFFVEPSRQRAGIGRRLCEVALARAREAGRRPTTITVKSTPVAVPAYEALGFRTISMGGGSGSARLVPMILTLQQVEADVDSTEERRVPR